MKHFLLIFFLSVSIITRSQVYMHDFGSTVISAHPYNSAPGILQSNLSGSSWTNSTASWTSYAGSAGEAIAIANSGGNPSITLTFNVAAGYNLNIASFDFWCQRSATGAQNWSMTINGITAGSGIIPTTGAAIGITNVANPVNNLSGTITVIISLSGASATGTFRIDDFTLNGMVVPNEYVLLDNFNRNDSIRPAIPSSGGSAWWVEQEPGLFCSSGSLLEKIRIKNNQLELSSCTYSNSTCFSSPTEATGMNMTGKYPTIFSTAAGTMEWYFNMQQSRADPNGFASGEYGAAFVIGSNTNNPLASSKTGYAVIFGEAGIADPLRLISFNGSVFNSTTFTNILSVPSPAVKTNYMSIKVTYNPCNNEWSLTARDDGVSFADPSTVSGVGATAVNTTFTSTNLLWLGQVWNHGNTCSLAKFDNVYIPKAGTNTGTYTWNGNVNNDFQLANNWTPKRQCINAADKLVFNSTSPVASVLTNVPSQTIGQLTVTNNRTISLSDVAGDGAVSTLAIAGSSGTDLQVDAGSSLNLDVTITAAGDAMVINLGAGATANISGTVSFNATPGGTKAHRLQAADAMAITVNSGGLIKAMGLSGNPFGSTLPLNTVVFNSGAAYECYSGANPFGLSQPASKVIFNTGSTYRHYASGLPSILGRTYANCECYANMNVNTGGAAAFTVNSFSLLNGIVQFTGSSNSMPLHTNIKGDLLLSPGTTFNYDPVAASSFTFNSATTAQKINSAGTITLGKKLTVRLNSSYISVPQLTVETDIKIGGVLDIVQGTINLTGNIHLLSDGTSTASIAPITGAVSYGTGRFIAERFIPNHNKAWQFLAVPTTGQTVNAAWQEGNAPLVAGTAGLGTIINSNIAGTGFDIIGGSGSSMKTYDTTGAGTWKGISRTDTAIYNKKGYMIFVRGDRTVTAIASPATATTLRTTGKIFDPVSNIPPVTTIGAGKFESIGNPYASAVDFSNDLAVVKSANVQKIFYVWDPKLGTGYGSYQTCTKGSGTDYTVSPGGGSYGIGGSVNNTIQSGQAFFVRSVGGAGTITFTENAKITGSSLVTRQGIDVISRNKELRTDLYLVSRDHATLLDGVLTEFDGNYSNSVDVMDALKLVNTGESIGIINQSEILSVERKGNIHTSDTITYKLDRLKLQQYEFEFRPMNISRPGLQAFLEDSYLRTSSPVSLSGTSRISFNVLNDPASYASNRFRLVFKQKRVPVMFSHKRTGMVKQENDIVVYPNPATGKLVNISFINQPAGRYLLQFVNPAGEILLEQDVLVIGSLFKKQVRITALGKGVYKLIIQDGSGYQISRQVIIY